MAEPDDATTADPDEAAAVDDAEIDHAGPSTPRASRLDIAAGFVVLAYVLWIVVQFAVLLRSDDAYDRFQDIHAGTGARVLLSLVLLAVLWHTVQGALALLTDQLGPTWLAARTQRGVVWFVVLAAGIPGVLVVLWPAIAGIPT